jgi:hypothetical protein
MLEEGDVVCFRRGKEGAHQIFVRPGPDVGYWDDED